MPSSQVFRTRIFFLACPLLQSFQFGLTGSTSRASYRLFCMQMARMEVGTSPTARHSCR